MINQKMGRELNAQINAELYSSYLYLSMSAYFHSTNLDGFAGWMRVQAQEELVHAMKLYDYVIERGGIVSLRQIDAPPSEWKSPMEVFEATLKHEQKVTGLINDLVDISEQEKDQAAGVFLQWFVSEQVEEEESVWEVLDRLRSIKDTPDGMFMLDGEMGQRVFTPPSKGDTQ